HSRGRAHGADHAPGRERDRGRRVHAGCRVLTRVLVVDDEPSILRALRINLAARNYQVSTASDGASGLAAMARDRPDVMILDLGLGAARYGGQRGVSGLSGLGLDAD